MNPEPVTETGASAGGHEGGEPPVGQPHDAAAGHGEHKIIGAFAIDSRRQLGGDKARERDGPGLVRFRGTQDDPAADIGEGAPHIDAAAVEVDVADAQGGGLAPAQAGVGQHQDQ
jgi:hypothetical protein